MVFAFKRKGLGCVIGWSKGEDLSLFYTIGEEGISKYNKEDPATLKDMTGWILISPEKMNVWSS